MLLPVSHVVATVLLSLGQIPLIESADIAKNIQLEAVAATVQVRNNGKKSVGSGVLISKSEPFVYVLTSQHVVQGGEGLEVAVFAEDSYPKPKTVYDRVKIVAEAPGLVDLALIRIAVSDGLPIPAKICPERRVPETFTGLAVGCDAGASPTTWIGKIPGKKVTRRPDSDEICSFWEVDRKPIQGRSGGPLFDQRGYLLGICSGSNRQKSYFTHIGEIHRFLKSHGYQWLIEESSKKEEKKAK